ncbi:malate permease [Spiroplasma sabaudiense Ar-1343]|uniref:Malate permease n=1 Tax=Spiroplasma sabaudiense Ar-1343 TaxID=1276257 RepID=W6AB45_9MOLU|nr:AEC family transporter [Spiroplasma sabaudiense]AHI54262.1 malate permease [Spiroplasma sabaudiense Ar-1343]
MNIYSSAVNEAISKTLLDWPLWSAIIATISVISLGFILTVKGIINKDWDQAFIKFVMLLGLPSLVLKSFLADIDIDKFISELSVIILGFIFYLIMTMVSRVFFLKYNRDIQDTLAMCVSLGSTAYFGLPLIREMFGTPGELTANNFNISYWVFLCSVGFLIMSKDNTITTQVGLFTKTELKLKKENLTPAEMELLLKDQTQLKKQLKQDGLVEARKMRNANLKKIFSNPVLIATMIGFFIWATQLIPGIRFVSYNGVDKFSPLRVDLIFPPIANILTALAAVCTPLAWIAIGMKMAKGNIKKAIKDKNVWYATFIRIIVVPIIALILTIIVATIGNASGGWTIDGIQLSVILIMAATPPANVIVVYAINFDKEPELACNLTSISTIAAIVTMPIWTVIGAVLGSTPIFN